VSSPVDIPCPRCLEGCRLALFTGRIEPCLPTLVPIRFAVCALDYFAAQN